MDKEFSLVVLCIFQSIPQKGTHANEFSGEIWIVAHIEKGVRVRMIQRQSRIA